MEQMPVIPLNAKNNQLPDNKKFLKIKAEIGRLCNFPDESSVTQKQHTSKILSLMGRMSPFEDIAFALKLKERNHFDSTSTIQFSDDFNTLLAEDPQLALILMGGKDVASIQFERGGFPIHQKSRMDVAQFLTKEGIKNYIPSDTSIERINTKGKWGVVKTPMSIFSEEVQSDTGKVPFDIALQLQTQVFQSQIALDVLNSWVKFSGVKKQFNSYQKFKADKYVIPEIFMLCARGYHIIPDGKLWASTFIDSLNFDIILVDIESSKRDEAKKAIVSKIEEWFVNMLPDLHELQSIHNGQYNYYLAKLMGDNTLTAKNGFDYEKTLRRTIQVELERIGLNMEEIESIDNFWGKYVKINYNNREWAGPYAILGSIYYKKTDYIPPSIIKEGDNAFNDIPFIEKLISISNVDWCTSADNFFGSNSLVQLRLDRLAKAAKIMFDLSDTQYDLLTTYRYTDYSFNPFCIGNPVGASNLVVIRIRWSSQICWKSQHHHKLNITPGTSRSTIQQYIGLRSGKNFRFTSDNPQETWCGDSDLNAARNMALRALVSV